MTVVSKFINFSVAGLISAALITGLVSCGEDKKDEDKAATTTTVKYADVSAYINASCATSACHDAVSPESGYNMATRAGTATKASSSASRIEQGTMPPLTATAELAAFKASADSKAKLIAWLKAGATE